MGIENSIENQRFNYGQHEFNYENHIDESIVNPNGKSMNKRDDEKTHPEFCCQRKSNDETNGRISVNDNYERYKHQPPNEETPSHIAVMCYVSMIILTCFGYLRDFLRKISLEKTRAAIERNREGYVPLYRSFESFYTRNIYRRICDCWNKPICSVPGAVIQIVDRLTNDYNWTFSYPGTTTSVINMGSYNYLGFAENNGKIIDNVETVIKKYGIGLCTTRHEIGTTEKLLELEEQVARYLGVESSIVFGMGFATNSTNIQVLAGKGCLILSDELNHASLILGCRTSGATIKVFRHNNMKDLENKLRSAIISGQPRINRPWKKIIIVVEGIYSMEGTIVNLPYILSLKKKYKCYVYLDEAHSIGALGPHGKGVVDYFGCDANQVDLLMGTFTKSFGAAGGYIAGRREVIQHIKIHSFSASYATVMSPLIAEQIIGVIKVITGQDETNEGQRRIRSLARNTVYFRKRLKQMGFIVIGNDDSPVVPLMLGFCSVISHVVRVAITKGLGFIGAGFPATSLTTARIRFCISASHTKEMLDKALEVMNQIGDQFELKSSSRHKSKKEVIF